MSLLEWDRSKHQLGVDEMDETHLEFAHLVNALGDCSDPNEFKSLFAELCAHTKDHFANEYRLMTESGFPAITEHRSEHDRVLGQLNMINQRVQDGRISMGKAMVEDLPAWFDLHAATMDSALVAHLKQAG